MNREVRAEEDSDSEETEEESRFSGSCPTIVLAKAAYPSCRDSCENRVVPSH